MVFFFSVTVLSNTHIPCPPPHIFTANIHLKTGGSMRRKLLLIFCFFAFFFYLLAFPRPALESARHGLLLWYHSVVPVLFPFMLLGNFALRTGLIYPLTAFLYRPLHLLFGCSQAGCFAILSGFLCGFPVGAKITSDLAAQDLISADEENFLLNFCNNLSPAFLLSYLASKQLNAPKLGPVFLGTVLGASLLYGFLRSFSFRRKIGIQKEKEPIPLSFSFALLDPCIMDAIESTLRLGGYLVLFSILDGCISHLLAAVFSPSHQAGLFIRASIEVTNGLHLLAISSLPWSVKFISLSACASFGGFCTLAQTIGIAHMNRRKTFAYIKSRVCITLLSVILCTTIFLF